MRYVITQYGLRQFIADLVDGVDPETLSEEELQWLANDAGADWVPEGGVGYIDVEGEADEVVQGAGDKGLSDEEIAALRVLYARTLVAGDGGGNGETEESANRISQNASIRELIGQVGDHPDLNEVVELRSEPQDGGEGGAE